MNDAPDPVATIAELLGVTDQLDRIQIRLVVDTLGRTLTTALARRAKQGRKPMALFVSLARQEVPHDLWATTFIPREPRGERLSGSSVPLPYYATADDTSATLGALPDELPIRHQFSPPPPPSRRKKRRRRQ